MKTLNHLVAASVVAASALLGLASAPAQATPVVIDVGDAQSINLQGEAGNTVWFIDVGANAALNSLSWSLDLNAFASGNAGGNPDAFLSAPGTEVYCQWWGRDSVSTGSFLSDALRYIVRP